MIDHSFESNGTTKVNAEVYTRHLRRELIPAIERLYANNDFIFVQDRASSHTSRLCQDFLREKLKKKNRFVASDQWPLYSPDLNPLEFYFWNQLKKTFYEESREEGEF